MPPHQRACRPRYGLRVATHSWSDAVAIVANMQVIASLENGITVELTEPETH
jgi:hypothetical protein